MFFNVSSPSSAILVSLWFILTSLIVFYRRKTAISRLPFFLRNSLYHEKLFKIFLKHFAVLLGKIISCCKEKMTEKRLFEASLNYYVELQEN